MNQNQFMDFKTFQQQDLFPTRVHIAQEFLEEKGMKVADEYSADSFSDYIELRGIGKAYGGKVQPRHALGSTEKP